MSAEQEFLLDADVLIQAHRMYYAFDICPGYWQCLTDQHGLGKVASIDRVRKELLVEADALVTWVNTSVPAGFFEKTDTAETIARYQQVIAWVQGNSQYQPAARATFAAGADGWLVAHALQTGRVVVTMEVAAPQSTRKVKIPDVCNAVGVSVCNTFDMLRLLDTRFHLEPVSQ